MKKVITLFALLLIVVFSGCGKKIKDPEVYENVSELYCSHNGVVIDSIMQGLVIKHAFKFGYYYSFDERGTMFKQYLTNPDTVKYLKKKLRKIELYLPERLDQQEQTYKKLSSPPKDFVLRDAYKSMIDSSRKGLNILYDFFANRPQDNKKQLKIIVYRYISAKAENQHEKWLNTPTINYSALEETQQTDTAQPTKKGYNTGYIKSGRRGGHYYINKNGNKTYVKY